MMDAIFEKLSQITEEEQFILVQENTDPRSIYSKSGRFIIERRHMSSISFGEATAAICIRPHPRFRDFPAHSHDYIEIMYVYNGSITHVIDDREIVLNTHDIMILGKDTKHSINAVGNEDIGINIIVSTDLFESLYYNMKKDSRLSEKRIESLLRRGGLPFCIFSATHDTEARNIMESMIWSCLCENRPNGYILRQSMSLLLSYLAARDGVTELTDSETTGYKEQIKKKILDYIQTSYSTATLVEAAQMLGLSPSYLSRLVYSYFGMTFKEMLMGVRFDAACNFLLSTDIPIGEIINRVGYENSSYFHKEFKKRFGQTPNAYRKSH